MRTVCDVIDILDTIREVRKQLYAKDADLTNMDSDIIDLLNGYEELLKDLKIAK